MSEVFVTTHTAKCAHCRMDIHRIKGDLGTIAWIHDENRTRYCELSPIAKPMLETIKEK